MDVYQFLKFFLLFTFFGCLFVTGWYFITRGEKKILPDGTVEKTGMIFKGWFFFWMKERPDKTKIFYEGQQLSQLIDELQANYPDLDIVRANDRAFIIGAGKVDRSRVIKFMKEAQKAWDIKLYGPVSFKRSDNVVEGSPFLVYKEYPNYVFPEWVRMPMARCITCFSSVYASIFYWCGMKLIREDLFAWAKNPTLAVIAFWIVFCFSLSVLGTALVKKFH